MGEQANSRTERLRRVQRIFHRALRVNHDARGQFLRRATRGDQQLMDEVERLLAHHRPADSYLDPLCADLRPAFSSARVGVGRVVGAYRLTRRIESGGSGTVWAAERADGLFEQKVAVKLLSWGLVSAQLRRRFDDERRTLAQLEHPYVARLIDGGATADGVAYLVMEHVEGTPIDAFCDDNHLALDERLELFRKVCEGVKYAHHHLVIHCDLKPGNILVTADRNPKLIDFGLSRLRADVVDDLLDSPDDASRAFTPRYASPEQKRGDVLTTATDVYSLGVILARLIGSDRTNGRHATPAELQSIVERATQFEPQARYLTVEQLAEDIRLYQMGLPVLAHPQTAQYRLGKFARRHAIATGLSIALLLALTVGSVGMTVAFLRASDNARAATQAGAQAAATAAFLTDALVSVDPWNRDFKGPDYTVRQLLDDASARIADDLAEFPAVQTVIQSTLGRTYRSLGMYDEAKACLQDVLAKRLAQVPHAATDVATAQRELGEVLLLTGQLDEAEKMLRSALTLFEQDSETDLIERADTMQLLGRLASARGQYQQAEDTIRAALRLREQHSPADKLADTLHQLGETLVAKAEYANAVPPLRRALSIRKEVMGERHALSADTMGMLGYALAETGQVDEARELLDSAAEISRQTLGDEHPGLANSLNVLALFHSRRRALDKADALFREVLAIDRKVLAPDHPDVAAALNNLGQNLRTQGRYVEAVPVLTEALEILIKNHGPMHPNVATANANLGACYWSMGQRDDALKWITQAHTIRLSLYGESHPHTLESLVELSSLNSELNHLKESENMARNGLALTLEKYPQAIKRAVRFEAALAKSLMRQDRLDEAEATLKSAHARALDALGSNHWVTHHVVRGLVHLYELRDDPKRASFYRDKLKSANADQ